MRPQSIAIGILSVLSLIGCRGQALAQSAADPKAINFNAIMDTLARTHSPFEGIVTNLNTGFKNADRFEDFEIVYNTGLGYSGLRFGGPWLFDTNGNPGVGGEAEQYGDFDGDGIGDIIDHDGKFHKGFASYPYFDSVGGAYLVMHGSPESKLIGAVDFDGDGILDEIIQQYSTGSYLALYKGRSDFGANALLQYPDDSLIVTGIISGTVAQFNPTHPEEVIFYAGIRTGRHIGLLQSHRKLSSDTVQWLTDTSRAPEINVQNMLATDVTGDGIPDLLVSDGQYVYIFKGGDDFGTYPLTKSRAYYRIPNPGLFDNTGTFLEVFGFGKYMHALGDLSGSGIPYILIEASLSDNVGVTREYGMIYACGKALDSLYDGIVIFPEAWGITLDTLHSIDSSGRSALLIVHTNDPDIVHNDADMLLYRACDSLPHRTNPNLAVEPKLLVPTSLSLRAFPSIAERYVKVHLASPKRVRGELSMYDLLGRVVQSRSVELDAGENIEYFETNGLASGTYVVRLRGSQPGVSASTKFIVQH